LLSEGVIFLPECAALPAERQGAKGNKMVTGTEKCGQRKQAAQAQAADLLGDSSAAARRPHPSPNATNSNDAVDQGEG
jgi:hypothetical protein